MMAPALMEKKKVQRNQRLDAARVIACYSVVFIHIPLPGIIGVVENCLARFAVALFFISAGYFSWGNSPRALLKKFRHSFFLTVVSCIPPLGIGWAMAVGRGETLWAYLGAIPVEHALKELVTMQVVPLPYAWPLWFMVALTMIYGLWATLTALLRKLPYNALALLACLALAVHIYLSEGRTLLGQEPTKITVLRNVWMYGIPFFALGAWIAHHKEGLKRRLQPWQVVTVIVLANLLVLVERRQIGQFDLYLGSIVAALGIMVYAVVQPELKWGVTRSLAKLGHSSITFTIYAIHVPIYGILYQWRQIPAFGWTLSHSTLTPFVVAALSTLCAYMVLGVNKVLRPRK